MKKYVKCISNDRLLLTIGKVYELIRKDDIRMLYEVNNDSGVDVFYMAKRFKIVGCPCGINDCITHRKQS